MTGNIELALMRREADVYRSSGLLQEAIALYQKLLSSSPHLPRELRIHIEELIAKIQLEIGCSSKDECEVLSDEQLAVIKRGWNEKQTSQEDILISALSLYQVGRFADALAELKNLKGKGDPAGRATGLIAACLSHLHDFQDLAEATDRLAREFYKTPQKIFSFQLAIAERLLKWHRRDLALVVLGYLMLQGHLPPGINKRISELLHQLSIKAPAHRARSADRPRVRVPRAVTRGRPPAGLN